MTEGDQVIYTGATFSGDSGGPIFERDGGLVAIHKEIVNTAVDLVPAQLQTDAQKLDALLASTSSLIRGTAQMGLGLRSSGIRKAISVRPLLKF